MSWNEFVVNRASNDSRGKGKKTHSQGTFEMKQLLEKQQRRASVCASVV
jgi:hypothetical protein